MAKVPLKMDWSDLLSRKDDAPPTELEGVSSASGGGDGGEGAGDGKKELAKVSDREIQEKIQQILYSLKTGLADNLPDKGVKLRCRLKQLREERDRRNLRVGKDAGGSGRARESKTTISSDFFSKILAMSQEIKENIDMANEEATCFQSQPVVPANSSQHVRCSCFASEVKRKASTYVTERAQPRARVTQEDTSDTSLISSIRDAMNNMTMQLSILNQRKSINWLGALSDAHGLTQAEIYNAPLVLSTIEMKEAFVALSVEDRPSWLRFHLSRLGL